MIQMIVPRSLGTHFKHMRLNLTCLFWLGFTLRVLGWIFKLGGIQKKGTCVLDRVKNIC